MMEMCFWYFGINVKVLYRRAQAYMGLANLDLVEFDVKKALKIDSNNRFVSYS